ncbi:Pathogenicity locus [Rhodoblastus acidophilus]|uniref:Pathogenicity locus n=1 Tax=Rhodoblastus acidophilus TaxID=1074 RepID=A0A212S5J1_RHOAC|nr:helix-hairpin-helix domain-containing protein [Rhodoblastus acidophilus]PPQ37505.1 Mitomycin resistance protein mcrB [Rhodoblastus acidophilus]RAI19677.1 Mitomycin resistance protein mcrB [Rhodoblastus acidophilus]SNB80484.1 Pathogenicity locus [Rhodoblastus acidophilus]
MPQQAKPQALEQLRNVGKAALADFSRLGVTNVRQLAEQDADALYVRLMRETGRRHDPCVHDLFAAAIHQARTGEALNWWVFSPARKARQAAGAFPSFES